MSQECPFCKHPVEPDVVPGFEPIYVCGRDECPSTEAEGLLVYIDFEKREHPSALTKLKAFAERSPVHAEALRDALEGEIALAPLREYLRTSGSASD